MQLRHLKTIHPPGELVDGRFQKVTAIAWSPNHYRLAVATTDRYVTLYDEDGVQRDKFATKPADKASPLARNYVIRGLEFSQDSERLAVAQSDNIVFVYKLGKTWGDKKTICNKYPQTCAVTALAWPSQRISEMVFGGADGKVRVGNAANKTQTLFDQGSYIVALAASPDGNSFVSASADGKVLRYTFPSGEGRQAVTAEVARVNFVPYALGWGHHIVVAGNSAQVRFYDVSGGAPVKTFDYTGVDTVKEFSSAAFAPSGGTVVLGNFSRFIVYAFHAGRQTWEETGQTAVENLYAVTALRWKGDGSRLVTGSLCGVVDTYDAALRRFHLRGDFECTYTSPASVVVKKSSSSADEGGEGLFKPLALRARHGSEIVKVQSFQKRYVVAHSTDSLLVGDALTGKSSEVPYNYAHHAGVVTSSKKGASSAAAAAAAANAAKHKEKFFFDNENACMVFNSGELTIIEYGSTTPLEPLRTEHVSPHLLSVRISDGRTAAEAPVKKIAYLLDAQAIRVVDLSRGGGGVEEASINHDTKIDWLELNARATKLLFRDKRRALHLYDLQTQQRHTLLSFCNYVQWVPDSDVVVAQSRRTLSVWYSIDNPADVSNFVIRGDVEQIERTAGRTEVVIDEGVAKSTIALDEALIAFGAAVDAHDFAKAGAILDALKERQERELGPGQMSSGAEAMWTQLSRLALDEGDFTTAERCFSALGDVSKTKYLHKINALLLQNGGDTAAYLIQAHVAILHGRFKAAEHVLLNQGKVDEVVQMYRNAHQWPEALAVAEAKGWPHLAALKNQYFQYLLQTQQEEVAGEFKERNHEYQEALSLYLKGGFPAKAASLVMQQGMTGDAALCERVAAALINGKSFEKAGEFLEALKQHKRALECYQRGHHYNKAVALCRREFPAQVVQLYEEWGDFCVEQKQMDAASSHYIQASAGLKAISASIEARQWKRAIDILDTVDPREAKPYFRRIAQHLAEQKKYAEAEKYFVQAGSPQDAVAMYTNASLWEKAHALAVTYMSPEDVRALYVSQGLKLELSGKLKEAEKLYLTVGEADAAISAYRKARSWDDMVRLVSAHRPALLVDTHASLAQQLESEGNLKAAEQHYIKAKAWASAVRMYKDNDQWEDVLRVAKQHGGLAAYKQWAFNFALTLGGEAGAKQLIKRGLGDIAVDYAIERADFVQAFHIANMAAKHKIPDIHLQHAMALEDEGKFSLAEQEFLKAKKPKEAVDMWMHQQQWEHALRVAQEHEPPMVPEVLEAQAKALADPANNGGDLTSAEMLYLQAKKPEAAVQMYRAAGRFDDAIRLARMQVPRLVNDLQREKDMAEGQRFERQSHAAAAGGGGAAGGAGPVAGTTSLESIRARAKVKENDRQYSAAIDLYLEVSEQSSNDRDGLEAAWGRAVSLAMEHVHPRIQDVVLEVARKLQAIGRPEAAAEVLISIDEFQKAIDVLIQAKRWAKAKDLARSDAPHLLNQVLAAEQADSAVVIDDWKVEDKIKAHLDRNEWEKVYELVTPQGEEALSKYASMHAALLLNESKYQEALKVLLKYGLHVVPANFPVFKRLSQKLLSHIPSDAERAQSEHPEASIYTGLRDMLFKLVSELSVLDPQGRDTQDFERFLWITHLSSQKLDYESKGLGLLAARAATSLLRYTMDLPVDKAFYDAGMSCRSEGGPVLTNVAFVFLNRFVDLTDAMAAAEGGDDSAGQDIDNSDFLETDIPNPAQVTIPAGQFYPADLKDEARDWVLDKAMSNEVNPQLPSRQCDKCNKSTYEAALECHHCHALATPCCVTGYPVAKKDRVKCKGCNKEANKSDWNKFTAKAKCCPWCGNAAAPLF